MTPPFVISLSALTLVTQAAGGVFHGVARTGRVDPRARGKFLVLEIVCYRRLTHVLI